MPNQQDAPGTGGPKICVVMPCYNHEKYVGKAIDSILNQTYTNLELHIIDDGSTDGSAGVIAARAKDRRLRCHKLPENTHNFGARRLYSGFVSESDAKYVACLDSDDMWKPEKLAKQVQVMEDNPQYKACFTWDEVIHEEGAGKWQLPDNYSELSNRSRYAWFYFLFHWGNRLNACSMLMDRSVYLELNGFNPCYRTLGDFDLWMRLAVKYSFYIIPEKLTYYRRHGANDTSGGDAALQLITEEYMLSRRLIMDMDSIFFARTFPEVMIYADVDNPLVLAAEKIMVLLAYNRFGYDQLALEIYVDHAQNKGFPELMAERYGLGTKELNDLLRNCGLAAARAGKPHGFELVKAPDKAEVLLEAVSRHELTPEKLSSYSYAFLFDALASCNSEDPGQGKTNLNVFKQALYTEQKAFYARKERRTAVFVAGRAAQWDSVFEPGEWIKPGDGIYYSVLPRQADILGPGEACAYTLPEGKKSLNVFFKDELFVGSCMDAGVRPDLLVFVDCIREEYPWEYFLGKHAMDTLVMYIESEPPRGENETRVMAFFDSFEAGKNE